MFFRHRTERPTRRAEKQPSRFGQFLMTVNARYVQAIISRSGVPPRDAPGNLSLQPS